MTTDVTTNAPDPTWTNLKELVAILTEVSEALERTANALENIQYALERRGTDYGLEL
jgi:hypothetical protein